jgi:lipoprotein-anchoring transpeptidase ErfK/SrfK
MQRSVLLFAFSILLFAGTAAQAQTFAANGAFVAPPPPMVVVAPPPPPVRDEMGGGFIEFVFGGHESQRRMPPPPPPVVYGVAPPPAPVYANAAPVDPMLEQKLPGFHIDPQFLRQEVPYDTQEPAGTIVIDTPNHFLYLVEEGGKAMRYGIGVGRPGFAWSGTHTISAKKEWPDWVPPKEMLERQPYLPHFMAGGPHNPLGARALYLGSTLYRIHGSSEPWTIGHNVSSGCTRLRNADIIDLYNRVKVGTKVVVL